jgi:hypothetical protein
MMISAVFKGIGQKFSLIMTLNMYVSITNPFLGSSFNILGVTLSIPGAFFVFERAGAFFVFERANFLISIGEIIFMSGICSEC